MLLLLSNTDSRSVRSFSPEVLSPREVSPLELFDGLSRLARRFFSSKTVSCLCEEGLVVVLLVSWCAATFDENSLLAFLAFVLPRFAMRCFSSKTDSSICPLSSPSEVFDGLSRLSRRYFSSKIVSCLCEEGLVVVLVVSCCAATFDGYSLSAFLDFVLPRFAMRCFSSKIDSSFCPLS
jgi:hypothetical protein